MEDRSPCLNAIYLMITLDHQRYYHECITCIRALYLSQPKKNWVPSGTWVNLLEPKFKPKKNSWVLVEVVP